jgi:hypothetical protein
MPQIESEADSHNKPPVIAIGDEKRTAKARKDGVQKLEVLEQPLMKQNISKVIRYVSYTNTLFSHCQQGKRTEIKGDHRLR